MPFHIWSRGFVAVTAVAACLGAVGPAHAQQTGLFGGGGPMSSGYGMSTGSMGSGSMGATMGSSASGLQSSAFPSSSFPSTSFPGAGQMGSTGFGQNMMGQNMMGSTAMGGQRQGLVGQANTRFVGNQQAMQGQTGQNQFMNRQGQNAGARRQGQNANQNNQAGTQPQRSIRPQLVVAFDRPQGIAERSTTTLAKRFQKLSDRKGFEKIAVEGDGGNLVLRGEVDSAQTSRLATTLARMEPGVKSVKNELTVREAAPPATAE